MRVATLEHSVGRLYRRRSLHAPVKDPCVHALTDKPNADEARVPPLQLRCARWLACARCKLWWMTPEWGTRARQVPPETQFMLLEVAEGGPYVIALPLIDNNTFRGTLRGPKRCALFFVISLCGMFIP